MKPESIPEHFGRISRELDELKYRESERLEKARKMYKNASKIYDYSNDADLCVEDALEKLFTKEELKKQS